MLVTQKCQYALRALLALAKHSGRRPVKIAQIADGQSIPFRFLEVILSQLKQGGFVESRRGTDGGYLLARAPRDISVADIVLFVDGPIHQSDGGDPANEPDVLAEVWREIALELTRLLGQYTLADLKEREENLAGRLAPNYQI